MDRYLNKIIVFVVISIGSILFIIAPVYAVAGNLKDAFTPGQDKPLFNTAQQAGLSPEAAYNFGLEFVIGKIIQATLSLLGIIFIILMIYGGGLWMTAKGNEQQVDKAKDLITAAIIGLVIVVAAYAISYFVIKTIGGAGFKKLE